MARTKNAKSTASAPTRLEAALSAVLEAAKSGDVGAILAAGSELASAKAEAETELMDSFIAKVSGAMLKAKLEAPEGVVSIRIDFDPEAEGGFTVSPLNKGGKRSGNNAGARTGSGFRVEGPGVSGEYGSYSTAAKAVKVTQGLHPSVNGKVFWSDAEGRSIKSYQEGDSSWSARTGSTWYNGDYTLTITR
jgi:hypothetical protein